MFVNATYFYNFNDLNSTTGIGLKKKKKTEIENEQIKRSC